MLYFHNPFELCMEPRIQNLRRKMSFEGMGIFWDIYRLIRLGSGKYALDSIIALADERPAKERKVRRVLTEFRLFIVENGMVSLQPGLSASDFVTKEKSLSAKARMAANIGSEGYENSLFAEEMQQMDEEERQKLQQQISDATTAAVDQYLNSNR